MRDFRDAKVMAHALRDGLNAKAVETTHSECLELLAKAFGCESWNVLSAKIEATQSPEPDRRVQDPPQTRPGKPSKARALPPQKLCRVPDPTQLKLESVDC